MNRQRTAAFFHQGPAPMKLFQLLRLFGRTAPSRRNNKTRIRRAGFQSRPVLNLERLEERSLLVGTVFVDDSWGSVTIGNDPDGAGPATQFGTDSFLTIQEGINNVDTGGTVNVNAGTYNESPNIAKSLTLQAVEG